MPNSPQPDAPAAPWRPAEVPDVVLLVGVAQAYRDAVHDDFKLVVHEVGGATIRRRRQSWHARPGQLIVHHPGCAHAGTPDPGSGRWRVMCVAPETVAEVVDPTRLRFDVPVLDDAGLSLRYGELFALFERRAPALECEGALLEFLAALAERAGAAPPAGMNTTAVNTTALNGAAVNPGTVNPAMFRVADLARDYLGANLDRNVTLVALAKAAGASRFGVSRACVARFGLPPHALHLRLRLDRGCELIRDGMPLAEVSLAAGFHDQAHFTRTFSRTYGTTPRQFRESWDGTSELSRKITRRLVS